MKPGVRGRKRQSCRFAYATWHRNLNGERDGNVVADVREGIFSSVPGVSISYDLKFYDTGTLHCDQRINKADYT